MATWDDVRRLALALPESSERVSREQRQWRVKDKLFVWEPAELEEVIHGGLAGAGAETLGRGVLGPAQY